MKIIGNSYPREFAALATFVFVYFILTGVGWPDVNINILAVNGSDQSKEKDIQYSLPQELKADDILDNAGLDLDYDVPQGAYYVHGKISLGPKESKTLKVRVRDVWKFDTQEIDGIRQQIDASVKRLDGTDYFQSALAKKESLNQRLDYILKQEAEAADNTQKRIDRHRVYAEEVEEIRNNSVSIKYWRSKPSESDTSKNIKLVIDVENSSPDKPAKVSPEYYLPMEVRPEHFVDLQGFEVRYDPLKKQPFLTKEEELKSGEKKRYELNIIDMWNIPQVDIDNLKDRARKTYSLLEKTEYEDSAKYLVVSIKENLGLVEASQAELKELKAHISAFRADQKFYDNALKDVRSLEELLEAVRENLERSKVKNVLKKIKSFSSITSIAEAVFGTKPALTNFWRIIIGIIIFVGVLTTIHFIIWGKRSKDVKKEPPKEDGKKTS